MSQSTENIKEGIETSYSSLCYTVLEMIKLEKELNEHSAKHVRDMYQEIFTLNQQLQNIRKDFHKLFGNIADID